MRIPITQEEINRVLELADESRMGGSKWSGMTYEEGVIATIDWMTGYVPNHPMEDTE